MIVKFTKQPEKYLYNLKPADRDIVLAVIKNFCDNGHKSSFYKPLTKGVFELVANTDNHWHRILGMYDKSEKPEEAILTNAFAKKTNKTPNKEIDLTVSRMNTYLSFKT